MLHFSYAAVRVACVLRVSEWFAFVFKLFWTMFVSVCVCAYDAGSPLTMHVCLKLAQVLAASLHVCSSLCLLDMPIRRAWARCPCCEKWIQFIPGCREPDEWCYFCERLWEDWYAKKKWARTVDCMLMLATNSLRDNHYK
jgi:hypothetical protein